MHRKTVDRCTTRTHLSLFTLLRHGVGLQLEMMPAPPAATLVARTNGDSAFALDTYLQVVYC